MLLEYFKRYMKISRQITDKSVNHYVTGINTINGLLVKYDFPIKNVFQVSSKSDLESVRDFLFQNEEFSTKDTVGHHMYSVAFKHFCNFSSEDHSFFSQNITEMDFVASKPQRESSQQTSWTRNQIIITQSIQGANYLCENNSAHYTFIARSTGLQYMEGHHLIPMRFQGSFENNLDTYANVVCLCPTCHRLLHFGVNSEKISLAERLYEQRYVRLSKSGINLSRSDFLELICL